MSWCTIANWRLLNILVQIFLAFDESQGGQLCKANPGDQALIIGALARVFLRPRESVRP